MALWVDRHRPRTLASLTHSPALSAHLSRLAASGDIPHMLLYGPPGAGKSTRVHALLRDIFGAGIDKLRMDPRTFTTASGKPLTLPVISSNYHLEITPHDIGPSQDRIVVQELLKSVASTQNIDTSASRRFKVVVIYDADRLSRDAQAALRRTMEKFTASLRVVLVAEGTGGVIGPVRSRCLALRVSAPSVAAITEIVTRVAKDEDVAIDASFAEQIAQASGRNIRRAILMLESVHAQLQPGAVLSAATASIPMTDWEAHVKATASLILQDQTPATLLAVRKRVYELLAHCIDATTIIKTLAQYISERVDVDLRGMVVRHAAMYQWRVVKGAKAVFHIEAFVACVMADYRRFMLQMME